MKRHRRSIKRIACRALKALGGIFRAAKNSTYKTGVLVKALVLLCITNTSAERSSAPSPDTLLRRLRRVGEQDFIQTWRKTNICLLRKLGVRRKPLMALDFRTLPYYGTDQPPLVSDSRLPGTRFGIRFAMLSVVEAGRTFTLRVEQVAPFHSVVEVLERMLDRAPFKPRLLLLDRGFYAVEVILALKSRGIHFLMPAPRTASIKRLCEAFERGEILAVVDYTVRGRKGSARVKLIFIRKKTAEGWKTYAFSDLPLGPTVAVELYSCRWRIETNNREIEKFMARTTSRSMELADILRARGPALQPLDRFETLVRLVQGLRVQTSSDHRTGFFARRSCERPSAVALVPAECLCALAS
ncbi:MAG: transposase [Candidatus Hadarchaeum sp.]|uniref:transposase n=1 Tax=Candidatus Hadarchaeum sp. TaxID=2883567 RepID=UPI003D146375